MSPELRDPIIQEFQIPPTVTKCCSACFTRIIRKIGPHVYGSQLTDEEIAKLKSLLQEVGPKWTQLADMMGKSTQALKTFYSHNKKKYCLDVAVIDFYKTHPGEERHEAVTDGDESDLSTSSGDEREGTSDTASAESPNNTLPSIPPKEEILIQDTVDKIDERLLPPLNHPPRKHKTTEEYDSSATETADEENESSPANRQSPKVLVYSNQATITMVPSTTTTATTIQQNGPREPAPSPMNVQDMVMNVIERSLKTAGGPPKTGPIRLMKPAQINDNRSDITFVREYRNEPPLPPSPQQQQQPIVQQTKPNQPLNRNNPPSDGLATLSVVNSHGHQQQILTQQQQQQHPHGLPTQIAATITPVQPQKLLQQQQQQHSSQPETPKDNILLYMREREREPEPQAQTLDLSIKKPQRDSFPPPPAHSKPQQQPSTGGVTVYRTEPISHSHPHQQQQQQQPQNIPTQNPGGYIYRQPSKSPSIYVSSVPSPHSLQQQQQQQQTQHLNQGGRSQQQQQQQQHQQIQQQLAQQQMKNKPKLSPKIQQQQPGGPKGSITHGTPVNSSQPILVQTNTLSPRFEGILRQTPPSTDKIGSITQGTPVHMPPHMSEKRIYEYYKNNRQSPAQVPPPPQQQPSPQGPNFGSHYQRAVPFMEQPQLSSRQIILNDYITSQQMQGRGGRPEKELPSPRSGQNMTAPPTTMYYAEKDRSRVDYRTSPAEHINR